MLLIAAAALLIAAAVWGIAGRMSGNGAQTAQTTQDREETTAAKPVIYLYPSAETPVSVKLTLSGTPGTRYPAPDADGVWRVTAQPDGTLTDAAGREYSYLFWDGVLDTAYDFTKGFCVRGADTAAFLQETLAAMGLLPREYNEMIVYWLPQMENNAWNLISFQTDAYTEAAALEIEPAPDCLLRVFMAWKALSEPVGIEPQTFSPFVREGFAAVEWGGAQVR